MFISVILGFSKPDLHPTASANGLFYCTLTENYTFPKLGNDILGSFQVKSKEQKDSQDNDKDNDKSNDKDKGKDKGI